MSTTIPLPLAKIRQRFPRPAIADVERAVRETEADMEHLRATLQAVGPGVAVAPPRVDTGAPPPPLGAAPFP